MAIAIVTTACYLRLWHDALVLMLIPGGGNFRGREGGVSLPPRGAFTNPEDPAVLQYLLCLAQWACPSHTRCLSTRKNACGNTTIKRPAGAPIDIWDRVVTREPYETFDTHTHTHTHCTPFVATCGWQGIGSMVYIPDRMCLHFVILYIAPYACIVFLGSSGRTQKHNITCGVIRSQQHQKPYRRIVLVEAASTIVFCSKPPMAAE